MNTFLKECRKLINLRENLCFVIGNESCDLDSAVSAISLAFYYKSHPETIPTAKRVDAVVPILNVPRKDLPLKTEVTYLFKKHRIDDCDVTFKDDISQEVINNNLVVLVDHHVAPYRNVIAAYDHRPYDKSSQLSDDCELHIDELGSCSTLIAKLILESGNMHDVLELLYTAIILDTVNFSPEAGRYKDLDLITAQKIEKVLNIQNAEDKRRILFDELVYARADVSSLDSYQILYKDKKDLADRTHSHIVSLPGYPMLVQEYIKLPLAENNLRRFADTNNYSVILLMGMKTTSGKVERDIGLINICNETIYDKILNKLVNSNLLLEEYENCSFLGGKFFKQNNIKMSRKHVLPLVREALNLHSL